MHVCNDLIARHHPCTFMQSSRNMYLNEACIHIHALIHEFMHTRIYGTSIVVVEVASLEFDFQLSTFARSHGKSARANVDSLCARLCVCVRARHSSMMMMDDQ